MLTLDISEIREVLVHNNSAAYWISGTLVANLKTATCRDTRIQYLHSDLFTDWYASQLHKDTKTVKFVKFTSFHPFPCQFCDLLQFL